MKAQVFLVPSFRKEMTDPKSDLAYQSGLMFGMIVNCTEEDKLMEVLQFASDFGHHAEVSVLGEDEDWPSIESWRKSYGFLPAVFNLRDCSGRSSAVPCYLC